MRAVVIPAPGELAVEEIPDPAPGEYQALAKTLTCTLCNGTDSKILAGHFPPGLRFPAILGHESIGQIVAVGAKVKAYRVGDLVLRVVGVPPGETSGGYYSAFGGFTEYGLVGDGQAFLADHRPGEPGGVHRWWPNQQVVPPGFDPRLAGAFITFKEALSFAKLLGVGPGRSALVLGSGPVGFGFAKACQILGASPVVVLGRRDDRLALAAQFGADATINAAREDPVRAIREFTGGQGADYVIEGVGSLPLLELAPQLVARGGEIATYGIPPEGRRATFDYSVGAYTVRFMGPQEGAVHDWALGLLRGGAVDLRPFVTHELPVAEIRRGFDLLGGADTLKVVLHFG